jgi:uncharacterized protein (DUF1501 family)
MRPTTDPPTDAPGDRGDRVARRAVLAGGLAGLVGTLTPLVSARVAFGAPGAGGGTLVVVFLRGGMDGLSVVVPSEDPNLLAGRPDIAVRERSLLPLDRGFGLHPALTPLYEHVLRGRLKVVPAIATPDLSRSHFQAQDCLERGGASAGTTEGWLDRVLAHMDAGTTFRAVALDSTLPRSLTGGQAALSLTRLDTFRLDVGDDQREATVQTIAALYDGVDHPIAGDVPDALAALDGAALLANSGYTPGASYPDNPLGVGFREIAHLIKADAGLRVAALDMGGWDMHSGLGTVDDGTMKRNLEMLGTCLAAFATDLGDRLDDVTVVTMSEFGRRVEQNGNRGTDHGHGGVALVMGGGLQGGVVHGSWPGLAPEVLDHGDVPGANDYRDLLGELVGHRLGVSAGDLASVFPDHTVQPLGLTA